MSSSPRRKRHSHRASILPSISTPIGASYLVAPLFVGLLGFLADWSITAHTPSLRQLARFAVAVVIIALGTVVGNHLIRPSLETLFIAQNAATLFIVVAVGWLAPNHGKGAEERLLVFALVLLVAGVLAYLFERDRPIFDFAAVELTEQPPIAGYYVTTTDNAVVLITLGEPHTLALGVQDGVRRSEELRRCEKAVRRSDRRRIVAVPSNQIDRVWIGPPQLELDRSRYCEHERQALGVVAP